MVTIAKKKRTQSVLNLTDLSAKQQIAFDTEATESLFGGATEGGKSHWSRHALILWCSAVPGLLCDIFRLVESDVIKNHMEGENNFHDMLRQWEEDKLVKITQTKIEFYNGSKIFLEHCNSDKALTKHKGIARHVRIIEEATEIRERHVRFLRSWVRMDVSLKATLPKYLRPLYPLDKFPHLTDEVLRDFFPRIAYTTNPTGISAGYFRRQFVHARPPLEIGTSEDPQEGGFKRIYIPSLVSDNEYADAAATHRRVQGIGDEAEADALLHGNWDAITGDFLRQWDKSRHAVHDFIPPKHWFKFRAFDWGGYEPFCVLWFCVSDGEQFTDQEGRQRWFPRGALIGYREWYGCQQEKPELGIHMPNVQIAEGIIERTPETTSNITVTDGLPFQSRGGELMADEFAKCGVPLTRGNTARAVGWKRTQDYLIGRDDFAYLYFCYSCTYTIEYMPMLQRHKSKPNDAQEDGEATHCCDTVRMGVMTRPPIVEKSVPSGVLPMPQKRENTPARLKKRLQGTKRVGSR